MAVRDPELLIWSWSGRGRSLADFRPLARQAGLEVLAAGQQQSGRFIRVRASVGGMTQSAMSDGACSHIDAIEKVKTAAAHEGEECVKIG